MKALIYIIFVCSLSASAQGFVIRSEGEQRRRAGIIAEAKSFLDWKLVHPAVLAAATHLPEAQEIRELPPPKAWEFFNLTDPQVRFGSGKWALYYWKEEKGRRCTVYVPLKSRDKGHGFVAFEFEVEASMMPPGEKKQKGSDAVMTGMKLISHRYLTDEDAAFLILGCD